MSRIPPHIVDTIITTARIEEVIGEFVQLKRAGSNLKGLSPFADEKTPSFVVSPAKQIFKCFSTGKGGNVVSFLMEKEHYSYPEALRWLAEKYNIDLPEDKPLSNEEKEQISERESLFIINKHAKEHFVQNLNETQEGQSIGLSYFIERGFRKDIIDVFELGYSLDVSDDFTKSAIEKGYDVKYLETVGLTKSKDNRYFDFFRGRVMFPIHSITGRILGFGGRTLRTDKKIAKYFNSPESIIYNKSDILYGLYFAKGDIVKYDNCYLVEGYTDVISMYQAGVKNVVSSSGTSLTTGQIKLIKRYTSNVTLLYDGDAAGIRASFRGIDMLLEEGLSVQIVLFPDGDDPDSYSKKVSSEELLQYINEVKQDFISFKSDLLLQEGQNDPLKKSKLIHEIIESISVIPDSVARSVYIGEIANRFEIERQIIDREVSKFITKRINKESNASQFEQDELSDYYTRVAAHEATSVKSSTDSIERSEDIDIRYAEKDLIRIMIKYGANAIEITTDDEKKEISVSEFLIYEIEKDDLHLLDGLYRKVYDIVKDGIENKELYEISFFCKHQDIEIVQLATEFEATNYELSYNWLEKYKISVDIEIDKLRSAVFQVIYVYKLARINYRIGEIRKELSQEELDDDTMMSLLAEQVLNERIKKSLAEKLGRIIYN